MVILETAAIGAAGYGLYKGGEATARKGKEAHKDLKFAAHRREQQSYLNSKAQDRKDRIARLNAMRNGGRSGEAGANPSSSGSSARGLFRKGPAAASAPAATESPTISEPAASSSVSQRHDEILARLRAGRSTETADNANGPMSRMKNMFKRK